MHEAVDGEAVDHEPDTDAGADRIDADLKEQGFQGAGRRLDVTDPTSVEALLKSINDEFGAPTILEGGRCSCAGEL